MSASFSTGINALQDAIASAEERQEAVKAAMAGKSLGYLNWKDGDRKIVRFLTDDLITADFYTFIIDKGGKTKNFMVNPNDPDCLKRYMSPVPGVGWRKVPNKGIEEPITSQQSVGVAVLRQEVPDPDNPGKMIIEDVIEDVEVDGKTFPSRKFYIVQQSISNFWHTLALSCYKRYGTICDRDYEITRTGSQLKTKYDIIPLPEVADLSTVEAVQDFYFYGKPWNEDDPLRFLKCPQTLQEWAENYSSEDRYKFWLTPESEQQQGTVGAGAVTATATAVPTSGLGEFAAATTHNPAPDEAQAQPSSGTRFSSLRDTLIKDAKNS